jgi:hypothetical protein
LKLIVALYASYSKGGKHDAAIKGRSYQNNFKCAWKGRKPEVVTLIAPKKRGRKSNKNLKTMIDAINIQLPK